MNDIDRNTGIPENYLWKVNTPQPNQSAELNELFAALSKAQNEMDIAGLDAKNPFFKSKYATLAELMRASRPSLCKYGLSVIQQVIINHDQTHTLTTKLAHASGQWLQSCMKINPPKQDVQAIGSYITYLKRYCYGALVGVIVDDESDDDGNAATQAYTQEKQVQKKTSPEPLEFITKEQCEQLEYELQDHPEIKQNALNALNINDFSKMPKARFLSSLKRIREIIAVRKN